METRVSVGVKQEKQHTPRIKCSPFPLSNNSTISMGIYQLILFDWEAVFNMYVRNTRLDFPCTLTEKSYIPEMKINEIYTLEF